MNAKNLTKRFVGDAALAVTGLALTALPASANAGGVTTDNVVLRDGTSPKSAKLDTVPGGTNLDLQCQTAGDNVVGTYNSHFWAKVSFNGKTGYVSRAYVKVPDAKGLGECDGKDAPPEKPAPKPEIPADRQKVLDRGQFWVDKHVPYSQTASAPGPDGHNFRTDCSGFVAMAYNLTDKPYNTESLPEKFHPINKDDLKPGDIIGNLGPGTGGDAGHVVIFTGWVDDAHTQFRTIESSGDQGASAQTHTWGNSHWNKQAYRLNGW